MYGSGVLEFPETEIGDLALPETTSAPPASPARAGALAEGECDAVGGHSVLAPAPAARPHLRPRHRHRPTGKVVDHVRRPQVVLHLVALPRPEDAMLAPRRPQRHGVRSVPRISDGLSQIGRGRRPLDFKGAFALGCVDRDGVGGAVEGDAGSLVRDDLVPLGVDPQPEEKHGRGDGDAHPVPDAPPVVEVGRAGGVEAESLADARPVPHPPARDVGEDDAVQGGRGVLCAL